MATAPIRIIQISDTHVFADKNKKLVGVPTYQSLEAVINLIKQKAGEFDMIIHSGDLAQDYSAASYTQLAEMLSTFKVPIYCIPGNHDDPAMMADVYPHQLMSTDREILTDHWQIILLSSHKPNAVEGYLSIEELTFLENCLIKQTRKNVMIVFHHQPMPVGSHWLDKLGLENAADFWKVVSRYKNVNTILFGHVHQQYETVMNNVKCYSVPSTCIQFKCKSVDFAIENLNPGIRLVSIYDDGRIETEVLRTDNYIGVFEENSKGY